MVTPFGLTPRWVWAYLESLSAGADDRAARLRATEACGISGKAFARASIRPVREETSQFQEPQASTLTIPVEGGSSVLKRRGADPMLSDHGKWRREHLGAWNAAYGRTPWFDHLMPQLEQVYADSEGGMRLEEFNSRLLDVALSWIDMGAVGKQTARLNEIGEVARFPQIDLADPRIKAYACEVNAKIDPEISIFDAIFRLGRDVTFGWICGKG